MITQALFAAFAGVLLASSLLVITHRNAVASVSTSARSRISWYVRLTLSA